MIEDASGPLAPSPVDMDDPNLWRVMIPSVAAVGSLVYHRGDPLKRCPATMMLIMGNAMAFTHRVPVMKWGIRPWHVIEGGQVYRLLSAPFVHGDLGHLVSNMASVLRSGYILEQRSPGWSFLGEALCAILGSGLVRLAAGMLQLHLLRDSVGYYSACAFGFSSAAFALRVAAQDAEARGRTTPSARPANTWNQFGCWAEVAMTHVIVPRSDLWAHVSGVVAGLLRVYLPREWPGLGALVGGSRRSMVGGSGWRLGGGGSVGGAGWQGGGGRLGRGVERVQIGDLSLHPIAVHAALGALSIVILPALRREAFAH